LRIFITAVTSYVGSNLQRYLAAGGHVVAGSDRRSIALGRPFDATLLSGWDAVVHCAHDFSPNAASLNIDGTKAIFQAAREKGVARQVFVSSYSARAGAASEYGRIKYELESYFLREGQIVARPGLVIGNGGLFGRNMRTILATPVLPLVDGGRDPIAFVGIQDFAQAMAAVIESAAPGAYNLFHSDIVTLRTLTETLNRRAGHRALYLSVPAPCALFLLSAAAAIGIRLPVDAGNLRGLKQNRECPYRSDLQTFAPQPCSLDAALKSALADLRGGPDAR
jgi:nucleoside-diphosphate-sugar epimerase